MTQYLAESSSITPDMIDGFFVGWPNPPSAGTLIKVMDSSAIDRCCDADVLPYYEKLGFITGESACIRNPQALTAI
ncbi:hypothetical protein BSZ39_02280 [Bowdeniella nasicola]|uniref:Uncharacterized protein n=1 Tax=Bowdeniella nasicola TaxID=208480 RepID=A0A1Q5Q4S1_9ACTO|nr:hypothetical protein [Bowdeniella nasicola]OKL54825.1 hypothetical protein BSZ39_02280 [Bowdeniella nasicola]